MNNNSFSKSYLKGEFSYVFWNALAKFFGVGTSFLTIYSLSIHDYGFFQLILVTYSGVATFLNIGAGVVRNDILRFEAEGQSDKAKKFFFESLGFRLIIGGILWASAFFLASLWVPRFGADNILLVKLFSFLFLHDALLSSLTTVIEMRKKFNALASRVSIAKISQLVVLVYFFFFSKIDLSAIIISILISSFTTLLILGPVFLKAYAPWKKIKASSNYMLFRVLTSYGKWELFQPLVGKVQSFVEPWAIKLFINTEAVAIFSIAQTLISTIAGFFPIKTLSTLVPSEIHNEDKLRKIFTYGTKYLMIFSLFACLASFIAIPILIELLFKKYLISLPYFNALLFTLPILTVSAMSTSFLIALRRQKFLFFQKILKSAAAIPLYLTLLPLFGLWGLVIHAYLVYIIMTISIFVYLEKMRPRLYIKWHDIVRFDESDRVFLKNIFSDIKKYLNKKFIF